MSDDLTTARVGLGRSGVSLPTHQQLRMAADHAMARDAVHAPLDTRALQQALEDAGIPCVTVETQAPDRAEYLRHPDAGRRLADPGALKDVPRGCDVALLLSDGLSATATARHGVPFMVALSAALQGYTVTPVIIAAHARVGLLNEVGSTVEARCAAIALGERPGLSAPDSLSLYFEVAPSPDLTDAERNCISNIRPSGLPVDIAAAQAASLIGAGLRKGISGTALKMEYEDLADLPPAGARDSGESASTIASADNPTTAEI